MLLPDPELVVCIHEFVVAAVQLQAAVVLMAKLPFPALAEKEVVVGDSM